MQMNDADSRLSNAHNSNQGPFKKVLVSCGAGLLRSPSICQIISNPPLVLVEWADEIIIANDEQLEPVQKLVAKCSNPRKRIWNLDLPDRYRTRERGLMDAIQSALNAHGFAGTPDSRIEGTRFDLVGTQ